MEIVAAKCSLCQCAKPLSDFPRDKGKKNGRSARCRVCNKKECKARYRRKSESSKAYQRAYYQKNRDERLEYQREYKRRNPEKIKLFGLRRNYGITLEEYNRMLHEQDGKCLVCGAKPDKALAVDHCHETGAVRGLLCSQCNVGIGMFKNDTGLLLKAIGYLERN